MTDEEMARDYALARQKSLHLSQRDTNLIQLAYLHGLKAGRPQWHDLRKDPTDLPKKNKSYWVYMDCEGNKIYRSIVWQRCWCGWNGIPLAWCEEPTFDKEVTK